MVFSNQCRATRSGFGILGVYRFSNRSREMAPITVPSLVRPPDDLDFRERVGAPEAPGAHPGGSGSYLIMAVPP